MTSHAITYRKQKKLSERKVLRFTGFHPNVGKTFTVFTSFVWKELKKAITVLNIRQENFRASPNIRENHKTFFSRLTFVVYGILINQTVSQDNYILLTKPPLLRHDQGEDRWTVGNSAPSQPSQNKTTTTTEQH